MAVLMKYIYQNRRGANSSFFSTSPCTILATGIWFLKILVLIAQFSLVGKKIFPHTLTFEQVRLAAISLWAHLNERLNLHRFCSEIFHTISDKNESMAMHFRTHLFVSIWNSCTKAEKKPEKMLRTAVLSSDRYLRCLTFVLVSQCCL